MNIPDQEQTDSVEFSYGSWRERFLRTILYITAGIGLIGVIAYAVTSPKPVFIGLAIGLYILVAFITFLPLPYQIRAGFFLLLLNAVCILSLLDTGMGESATLFYLAMIVLSTLTVSPLVGWITTGISLVSVAAVGWLVHSNKLTLMSSNATIGDGMAWLLAGVYILLFALVIIDGIRLLQQEFLHAQERTKQVITMLHAERISLEERVEERTKALSTSTEVSRRLSTILDQRQLMLAVVTEVQQAFNYYHVHIYLFDEANQNLVMVGGTGEAGQIMLSRGHKIPRERGLVGRAAVTNQVVLVADTQSEPDWLPNPLLPDTKSEVAVPIAIAERVLGVLDVQHNVINGLSWRDAEMLQTIANQVAIAVQNASLFTQTQRQAERETLVNTIGQKIQSTTSMEEVLQVLARELGNALNTKETRVLLGLTQTTGQSSFTEM